MQDTTAPTPATEADGGPNPDGLPAQAAPTAAEIVASQLDAYLDSPGLNPAWIAGWHAAINHAAWVLNTRPGTATS